MATASFNGYTATRKSGLTFYTPRCFDYTRNGKPVKTVPVAVRDQLIKLIHVAESAAFNASF